MTIKQYSLNKLVDGLNEGAISCDLPHLSNLTFKYYVC